MSEFTSEGSQAADEEVAHVRTEPNDDPLTESDPRSPSRLADREQDRPADEQDRPADEQDAGD